MAKPLPPDGSQQPAADDKPSEGQAAADQKTRKPKEIGGPKGPEPTRYGDWERKGIVSDF